MNEIKDNQEKRIRDQRNRTTKTNGGGIDISQLKRKTVKMMIPINELTGEWEIFYLPEELRLLS